MLASTAVVCFHQGMANRKLLKDPNFNVLIYQIEQCIHQVDQEALREGAVQAKDSAVKSALRKAELGLGGKKPAKPPKDALEQWTADLAASLIELAHELQEAGGVTKGEFIMALGATKDSLDTRREMAGTPRGYLDFLEGFLGQIGNG